MSTPAHELLKKYFGYDSFRPGQEAVIRHVMSGKDALVIMPTGGGKSLCFQIPALLSDGIVLVVSPLISLMKDQVDALSAAGVPAAFINSSLTPAAISEIQARALAGRLKLIYVAPERFAVPAFMDFLRQLSVSLLAVDEAHCISEWGHDFRPDYRNLLAVRRQLPGVPVLALTATATERVKHDIVQQLRLADGQVFVGGFDRPNLSYAVWPKQKSFPKLVGLLRAHEGESVIIYCLSRKTTEKLAEKLQHLGFAAAAYHAGLAVRERQRVQERFIRDEIRIVVATIAFGMGIDKPDVRLVVHQDLPKSVEGYYQETGRAGRDGLPSRCVLFFSYGDRRRQMFFIDQSDDEATRRQAIAKLDDIIRYCENDGCRRRYLLNYFGGAYGKDSCTGCDICQPDLRAVQDIGLQLDRGSNSAGQKSDPALFEKLRRLRKELADERNVPAFVIFGDRTLLEMAASRPTDAVALTGVFGVGEKKRADFGERFLSVIRAHRPDPDILSEPPSDTLRETLELLNGGLIVEEIAKRRGLTVGTIVEHLERLQRSGEEMDLSRLAIAPERLEAIRRAFAQDGTGRLGPVREILGEGYSYDEIRLGRLVMWIRS